ncbi:MAG: response regulator [Dehalococcoidales bacterium]|nr:response regulator [Dehalococcoidales bacterium]
MSVPGKILIVDDEDTIRWVLNRKLSKVGYQCDEAENAEQAVGKLTACSTDLVVLDIEMPGKHGNELLPEIQSHFPETSVVMASGVTDTRVIAQCIKDGAQDYIRKPFTLEDVLLSVTLALEKRQLELQIREYLKNERPGLRGFFLETIRTLVNNLEANDKYTAGHSQDVTELSLAIGQRLNLAPEELEDLYWGALLHDVGKIAIDPRILNKPGELTPEEYRHIMTHAIVGPNLVQPLVNNSVVSIISHHHDHYDGGGFNQLIAKEDIPLGARIVSAADAFNAMTSDRPYRTAMSLPEACAEMQRCAGSQFDPRVVNTLMGINRRSNTQA